MPHTESVGAQCPPYNLTTYTGRGKAQPVIQLSVHSESLITDN